MKVNDGIIYFIVSGVDKHLKSSLPFEIELKYGLSGALSSAQVSKKSCLPGREIYCTCPRQLDRFFSSPVLYLRGIDKNYTNIINLKYVVI